MSARAAALAAALVAALALAGCASHRGGRAADATPPPPPPAAATGESTPRAGGVVVPPSAGTVTAPWDTAARSRESRRAHVYPQGESAIGRRLVESLPDPNGVAASEGPAATSAPASPANPTTSDCWAAQLLATSDAARATRVREEAAALLGVPVRVDVAGGVQRVKAGGCLDADAAQRLVERARAERWPEAFRVQATP